MIPPKRFDPHPLLTGGCAEGLGAFRFFLIYIYIRDCQSRTWSVGQKKKQMNMYKKLQREQKKERNNDTKHIIMPEKDRRVLDRESLVQCQPRAIRFPPRIATMYPNAFHLQLRTLRVSGAQSTPLRESLSWSNQRKSSTIHSCIALQSSSSACLPCQPKQP